MLKITISTCIAALLIWCISASLSVNLQTSVIDTEQPDGASANPLSGNDDTKSALTIDSVAFHRANGLERLWRIEPDRRSITFISHEEFPADGSTYSQEFERTTSYEIQEVAPRSAIEVFILGVPPRTGGFVIERWALNEVIGSLSANIGSNGTPIGTPSPFNTSQNESYVVGGGAQLPLSERTAVRPPRREEFAVDSSADCAAIGADPEGRFVLVLTTAGELRQYDANPGDGSFYVLADATTHPPLLTVEGLMWRAQHSLHGRVWFLTQFGAFAQNGTPLPPQDWGYVVLHDMENDGIFETIEWVNREDPYLDELFDVNLWSSDFASF